MPNVERQKTQEYYSEMLNHECPDCSAQLVINQHGELMCSECDFLDSTDDLVHIKPLSFEL